MTRTRCILIVAAFWFVLALLLGVGVWWSLFVGAWSALATWAALRLFGAGPPKSEPDELDH